MSPNKMTFKQKAKLFFKRNLYAIVVSACALVLTLSLAVTALVRNSLVKKQAEENQIQSEVKVEVEEGTKVEASAGDPIVFQFPVADYTLGETFSDTELVHNKTLNEWTTHLGVDFIVQNGADVVACYDGVIESVDYNTLEGTVVTIDHGGNLKSIYKSLDSAVVVEAGQTVKSGEVIGKASSSASGESSLGAHVHFEVMLDGESVNPMNYLGEK